MSDGQDADAPEKASSAAPAGTAQAEIARRKQAGDRPEEVDEDTYANRRRAQDLTKYEEDLKLRRDLADKILKAFSWQLVFVNVVFVVYLTANDFHDASTVMQAWLAATVVEIIGVVVVITQYLFPSQERRGPRQPPK